MKKLALVFLAVVFAAGCGDQPNKKAQTQKDVNYLAQGMKYLSQQDIPKAIKSFDKAIQKNPQDAENYLVLGQVYLRLKNFAKASDTFSAATRIDPSGGETFYLLAVSRMLQGKHEEAIDAAKKSVEVFYAQQDQEKLRRSAALLKTLTEVNEVVQK